MSELYVLAYIKNHGRINRMGEQVVLRHDITELLNRVFGYTAKRVTTEVTKLRNKRCIREDTLESAERKAIYGASKGQQRVVVMLDKGYQKIDDFTERANRVYQELTGPLLAAAFSGDNKLSQSIAEWLVSEKEERTTPN